MPSSAYERHRDLSSHRYPSGALFLDGLRAVFGVFVTIGPLLILDVAFPLAIVLGALGSVFLAFALRVLVQGLSSIELSDTGISRQGLFARHVTWSDLTALKLAHFAVRRGTSEGWYQLKLVSDRGALKIDSTIDAFDHIVAAAVKAAKANGLAFDPATGDNLRELGHVDHRPIVPG